MRRFTVIAAIAFLSALAVPVVAQVMPRGTRITAEPAPPPGAPTATPAAHVRVDLPTPAPSPASAADAPAPHVLPPPADAAAQADNAFPVVISARIGEHPDRTRFVVELSDPVKFRTFTLSDPNRVVIDMPQVLWRIQGGPQRPTGLGAIGSYRYGLFRPGDSRIVIDLNTPVNVAKPLVLPPQDGYGYRIVFDLFPTTQAAFDKLAGWPADLRAPAIAAAPVAVAPPPVAKSRPRIVTIDPGHGGIDSGTIGIDGTMEKTVVLDVGKRLAKVLRERGYTVFMTRDSDVFIPLGERVAINRAHHSDLFISLHANSNPDPSVAGLSVYTLSDKGSDKEAIALANKENQSDVIAGVDLANDNPIAKSILIDLEQRDTMNRSSRFAMTLVRDLSQATDILPRAPHRAAAFVVLKAPDVPAVLIELGFLSNAQDDAEMRRASWRNAVADAIADAVDTQFGTTAIATDPPPPAGSAE